MSLKHNGSLHLTHKSYLAIAIPLTISTITTPMLGAVDTAVVGQLPNPDYIGGVAIGSMIFNTMFWLFGFLRVSTSGFAAQAQGANDQKEGILVLARPFLVALLIGISFILLQWPIGQLSFALISPEARVQELAAAYFGIRIWGSPFVLMNYVILGWLMGMSKIKLSLILQVMMNVMNIGLDLLFVKVFHWDVSGVAAASVIAEITAFMLGLMFVMTHSSFAMKLTSLKELLNPAAFKKMMAVNRDLMIRTMCLLGAFNIFTAKGVSFGTEVLAANAVLFQIHFIIAYFFDGFANASSIFAGKAFGTKDKIMFSQIMKLSYQWSIYSAILLAGFYYVYCDSLILLFTGIPEVVDLAQMYSNWLILFPFAASLGFIFYGIFTGATEAGYVRNSMLLSFAFYIVAIFVFVPLLGNHGLWLAFITFTFGRSVFLVMYLPKLMRKLFIQDKRMKKSIGKDETLSG